MKTDGEEVGKGQEQSFFSSFGLMPSHPIALVTLRDLRTR